MTAATSTPAPSVLVTGRLRACSIDSLAVISGWATGAHADRPDRPAPVFPRNFPGRPGHVPLAAGTRGRRACGGPRNPAWAPNEEVHMTTDRFNRLLPLAGIVAGLAIVAGLVATGS